MRNKVLLMVLAVVVALSLAVPAAYADMGKKCPMHGKMMKDKKELEGKFCSKAMFMLRNHEELGLTDKQIDDIKALKFKVKKEIIMKNAEIDVIKVAIKAEMWEETYDLNALNKLIDKKYDLKKENAKYLVKAISDVKAVLTKEQKKKAKSLCMKKM